MAWMYGQLLQKITVQWLLNVLLVNAKAMALAL